MSQLNTAKGGKITVFLDFQAKAVTVSERNLAYVPGNSFLYIVSKFQLKRTIFSLERGVDRRTDRQTDGQTNAQFIVRDIGNRE